MRSHILLSVVLIYCAFICHGQSTKNDTAGRFIESPIELMTNDGKISGTLTLPAGPSRSIPVALIIAGSGPTDRNGNNPMMKNESLKLLAHGMAEQGVASVRYDKRGIAASALAGKSEIDLRFENYINDATGWLKILKADKRFLTVTVIGHSEGSLIGMIAARNLADKYISLAGLGVPAAEKLKVQLAGQPPVVRDSCYKLLDMLAKGNRSDSISPLIYSLFRPAIQPYLISWFRYDPAIEISKLQIPVLIVQGTTDIQVSTEDADILNKANTRSSKIIINQMNHVLKTSDSDRNKNIATYSNPGLPLHSQLLPSIIKFIKEK